MINLRLTESEFIAIYNAVQYYRRDANKTSDYLGIERAHRQLTICLHGHINPADTRRAAVNEATRSPDYERGTEMLPVKD